MTTAPSRPRLMVMTTIPETLAAFMVTQLKALAGNGYEVHVVSSPGPVLDSLDVGPDIQKHSISIQRRPHPVRDGVSLWSMLRLIRKVRPQIVHAHTPKAGLIGMAAAKMAGVPIRLYTVHGLPLLTRDGIWRTVLETAEKTSIRLATQTYAVSQSVRELLVELNLCPAASVSVLGNGSCAGVDVRRFCPRSETPGRGLWVRKRYGIPAGALVATFVGRLARDKGIAVLAEAWPIIAQDLPSLHLLVAGERDTSDPVPEPILSGLLQGPRVHYTGTVQKEDVPGIFAATDIGLLPTYREGLPQTALEAGAAGVPMVASRVSGVVSAIEDGVTGILVPAGAAGALANAIRELATDSPLRRRLGDAARVHVTAKFSEELVNRLWTSEYLRLVKTIAPSRTNPLLGAGLHTERTDAG